jgi:hypothetical protein
VLAVAARAQPEAASLPPPPLVPAVPGSACWLPRSAAEICPGFSVIAIAVFTALRHPSADRGEVAEIDKAPRLRQAA